MENEEIDDIFNEEDEMLDQNEASENFEMVLNERGIIQPPISNSNQHQLTLMMEINPEKSREKSLSENLFSLLSVYAYDTMSSDTMKQEKVNAI